MQITVLVERMNGNGFRASGGPPFEISTEGATRDEALKKFEEALQTRIKNGAEIVTLQVGEEAHPLMKFAGMYKDNPLFDEWQKAIEEYRDMVDKDEDRP
jgi:predicted RNase H-like HicB family nuclease